MKTLLTILLLAVCLLTVSAVPQRQTWEYKFEYKVNEKKANELASQGWELTAIGNEAGSGPVLAVPFMVFRRPK